jgi:hypothetical protein
MCLTENGILGGTWSGADIIKSQVSLSGKLSSSMEYLGDLSDNPIFPVEISVD